MSEVGIYDCESRYKISICWTCAAPHNRDGRRHSKAKFSFLMRTWKWFRDPLLVLVESDGAIPRGIPTFEHRRQFLDKLPCYVLSNLSSSITTRSLDPVAREESFCEEHLVHLYAPQFCMNDIECIFVRGSCAYMR